MAAADSSTTPLAFDKAAMKKRASLLQQQWDDYKTRFMPVEQQVIDTAGTGYHTNLLEGDLKNAKAGVNAAYANVANMSDRSNDRFGIADNPAVNTAYSNDTSAAQAATMNNATNTARNWDLDRRNAMVSGSAGAASKEVLGVARR